MISVRAASLAEELEKEALLKKQEEESELTKLEKEREALYAKIYGEEDKPLSPTSLSDSSSISSEDIKSEPNSDLSSQNYNHTIAPALLGIYIYLFVYLPINYSSYSNDRPKPLP